MKIIVQRKVEMWIEEIYDIDDESEIEDAVDELLDCDECNTLWDTQENIGPVAVYDSNWKCLYKSGFDE